MRFHRPICRFPRRRRRRRRPDEQMRELNGNALHQLITRTSSRRLLCPRSAMLRRPRNRSSKQASQIAPKRRVKPNRFRAIHGAEQAIPEKRVQLPQSLPFIAIQHSHIKPLRHHESLQPYAISRRIQHPAARPAKPSKRPYRAERRRQSSRKPRTKRSCTTATRRVPSGLRKRSPQLIPYAALTSFFDSTAMPKMQKLTTAITTATSTGVGA